MKLTPGFWTHVQFKDVFVQVFTYEGEQSGQDVYSVDWWNRGASGKAFPMGVRDLMGILPEDYKDWQPYEFSLWQPMGAKK